MEITQNKKVNKVKLINKLNLWEENLKKVQKMI